MAMATRQECKKRNRITNYGGTRTDHQEKRNKDKNNKTQAESKCRLCGKVGEAVRNIVCECPMLAQREYERRHDWVGRKKHWEGCRKTGSDVNEKQYKHEPEKEVENNSWKKLWDITIQTDHVIQTGRSDMVIIDKTKYECKFIGFACPFDSRIEKRKKYEMEGYDCMFLSCRVCISE